MKQKQIYVSPRSRVLQVMIEHSLLTGSIVEAETSAGPDLEFGGTWGGGGGVEADVRQSHNYVDEMW